jgi:uncharacterized membrane protein
MKKFMNHVKRYIIRGVIAIIPLALTYFVLRFLYMTIDKRIMGLIDDLIGLSIPGFGLILMLIILYIIGITASNLVGKQIFALIERITNRIPIIRTTYQIGKQISVTLLLPEKQVFKRAVLVDFLKPGIWTVGFVTGEIIDTKNNNQKLLKVFIPTPPNPTSGTMVVVKESETRDPGWTIEEAMKSVVSGGIIGPNQIR